MPTPAYLIQGNSLFRSQKTAALIETLRNNRGPLETETLRLSETSLADVLKRIRNQPFFAKTQVFVFQDASEWDTADLDLLKAYLSSPVDFSVLILEWEEEADPARKFRTGEGSKELAALVRKAGGAVEAAAPGEAQSSAGIFIRQKFKAAGKTADAAVLQKLEREWQDFPSLLDTALENMILAAGSNAAITLDMAESFEESMVKGDRFKLLNALLARNTGEALNGLARLVESGEDDPVALIIFFHSQFRLYWQARRLETRGMGSGQIYERLGISARRAHFFSGQMKVFNLTQLEGALERLFELDRAVKSGEEEARNGLEKWIVRTAGK